VADQVAELAFVASRPKIYFATWRPSAHIGATAARCVKNRFVRVGYENQIPKRISLNIEYFNADVFFTSGVLSQHMLVAYEQGDEAVLERLLLINLFSQGSGFWQMGKLKPTIYADNISHHAEVYSDGENFLFWSGFDINFWREVAHSVSKSKTVEANSLNRFVLECVQRVSQNSEKEY
jgi:hypothetical protein